MGKQKKTRKFAEVPKCYVVLLSRVALLTTC
jgi:hypothetical protein